MNGTKRIRFSVADFVIILMILACVIGVAMRYNIAEKLFSKTKAEEVTVSFSVSSATENTEQAFTPGAVFTYEDMTFGRLHDAGSSAAVRYYENDSGILTAGSAEGLYNITGTFVCQLVKTDSGYLLDGKTYIAAGSTFTLRCGAVRTTVLITSVGEKG